MKKTLERKRVSHFARFRGRGRGCFDGRGVFGPVGPRARSRTVPYRAAWHAGCFGVGGCFGPGPAGEQHPGWGGIRGEAAGDLAWTRCDSGYQNGYHDGYPPIKNGKTRKQTKLNGNAKIKHLIRSTRGFRNMPYNEGTTHQIPRIATFGDPQLGARVAAHTKGPLKQHRQDPTG